MGRDEDDLDTAWQRCWTNGSHLYEVEVFDPGQRHQSLKNLVTDDSVALTVTQCSVIANSSVPPRRPRRLVHAGQAGPGPARGLHDLRTVGPGLLDQ